MVIVRKSHRIYLIPLLVFCFMMLIPSSIVLANYITDPTVGMNGVSTSDLTVGFGGISDFLIDFDNPGHINPTSPVYPVMILLPIIFFGLAILLIVGQVNSDQLNIQVLILIAVLITLALAMLTGINTNIRSLTGL